MAYVSRAEAWPPQPPRRGGAGLFQSYALSPDQVGVLSARGALSAGSARTTWPWPTTRPSSRRRPTYYRALSSRAALLKQPCRPNPPKRGVDESRPLAAPAGGACYAPRRRRRYDRGRAPGLAVPCRSCAGTSLDLVAVGEAADAALAARAAPGPRSIGSARVLSGWREDSELAALNRSAGARRLAGPLSPWSPRPSAGATSRRRVRRPARRGRGPVAPGRSRGRAPIPAACAEGDRRSRSGRAARPRSRQT